MTHYRMFFFAQVSPRLLALLGLAFTPFIALLALALQFGDYDVGRAVWLTVKDAALDTWDWLETMTRQLLTAKID